ncbi:hypothetical protein SYNPS1DRAFT_22742 [Syncephalis pseudoplumigaleata]|uniref:Uncharacterized protein n=1 Tax=Syncephalis pseudoplumigaleata TaxID=1712513 RepID=A0A4P9YYN2_9FUNG|nr:hypothetical protein SYNPS1DRAFT_24821 [Syncephalis pseudoplumigaleata]RKP25273.1 hypothetical protein SYNPS1DRAFT_22742 [Syncephalis pseudoplumigaleata]|eukprot:RKP23185.1 hypothetical protein SYNPS1DRAFT_24821 [Syncephalis pseudoplumigaleata]
MADKEESKQQEATPSGADDAAASTPHGRLPSLRPSKDFTLGGKQKTQFMPTVPIKRNKKEPKSEAARVVDGAADAVDEAAVERAVVISAGMGGGGGGGGGGMPGSAGAAMIDLDTAISDGTAKFSADLSNEGRIDG